MVPILFLLGNLTMPQSTGTSLTAIIFTSLSSTINYWRQKRIDRKIGLILSVATIPGAIVGASLTIPLKDLLGLIFGVFLIFVALRMISIIRFGSSSSLTTTKGWHRKIIDSQGIVFEYDTNLKLGLTLSFVAGLSSGLLGIGGGAVMVPLMYFVMHLPMHITVATSMFTMIFTSASGVGIHFLLKHVYVQHAILLAIGVIFGAQLGAFYSRKTSAKNLRKIFGVILLIISISMVLEYLGWWPTSYQ